MRTRRAFDRCAMAARGGSARYQREFESSREVCWGKIFFDHDNIFSTGGKLGKKGILSGR